MGSLFFDYGAEGASDGNLDDEMGFSQRVSD